MVSRESGLLDEIKSNFKIDGRVQRERRIYISIEKQDLIELCKWIKKRGYIHLSAMSVTDWLDKGKNEITYHVWSYEDKILITIKTKIDRSYLKIKSVSSIWHENAQIHERELFEMFGIKFEGNQDLTPLFLEDWSGPPPFRKDFNWREYVTSEFYSRENERELAYYD